MTTFGEHLTRTLNRYRSRVVVRTALLALLQVSCLIALLGKVSGGMAPRWALLSVGGMGVGALGVWHWRLLRRKWLTVAQAAAQLDRTLGLEARLLTAAEFSAAPQQPLLYPALLQDTAHALGDTQNLLPRIADRWSALLVAILLFLLLWPWPRVPMRQLAMRIPAAPPTFEPPNTPPPPEPTQEKTQAHHQRSSPSPQSTSTDQQPQPQQQESGSSEQRSGEHTQDASGASSQSSQQSQQGGQRASNGTQSPAHQNSTASSQTPATRSTGRPSAQAQPSQQSGAQGSQPQPSSGAQSPARESQDRHAQSSRSSAEAKSRGTNTNTAATHSQQDTGNKGSTTTPRAAQAQGTTRPDGTRQAQSQLTAGTGQGQLSVAQAEQLKAEIQQLLKDLQGELQHLQAQVAAQQKELPNPMPGTSTDPQLYGTSEQLEHAKGAPLAIQLGMDAQPTSAARPGGGVGKPSGQVSGAAPQQQPEDAVLAEHPTEESATWRQRIPPEYQGVFERLAHQEKDSRTVSDGATP